MASTSVMTFIITVQNKVVRITKNYFLQNPFLQESFLARNRFLQESMKTFILSVTSNHKYTVKYASHRSYSIQTCWFHTY